MSSFATIAVALLRRRRVALGDAARCVCCVLLFLVTRVQYVAPPGEMTLFFVSSDLLPHELSTKTRTLESEMHDA